MRIVLNTKQVDILAEFFANMAVAWFIAAFVAPRSISHIIAYAIYGILCLYTALFLKEGK